MHKKLACASEIESCLVQCHDSRSLGTEELRLQIEMLTTLTRQNAAIAWVVEEFCSSNQPQLLGFGFSMGVDEACVQRYLDEAPSEHWHVYLAHTWQQNPQVVLSASQLVSAHQRNHGIALNCYWSWRPDLPDAKRQELFWNLWLAYRILHMGYHLRAHIQFPSSDSLRLFLTERIGHRSVPLPGGRSLIYTTRSAAEASLDQPVWYFFRHRNPRIALGVQCLRILQCAQLFGFSNHQIATLLHLSDSTVGTYWEQMYEKVLDSPFCAEVFGEMPLHGGRRGEERRRRFLLYVQQHPSVARPILLGSVALAHGERERFWF